MEKRIQLSIGLLRVASIIIFVQLILALVSFIIFAFIIFFGIDTYISLLEHFGTFGMPLYARFADSLIYSLQQLPMLFLYQLISMFGFIISYFVFWKAIKNFELKVRMRKWATIVLVVIVLFFLSKSGMLNLIVGGFALVSAVNVMILIEGKE